RRTDHYHVHAPASRSAGAGDELCPDRARRGELQRPANCGHARRSRLAVPELRRGVMRLFFRQTLTIALKDLRSEIRTKEALNASVSFSIVILLLFSFAFEPTSEETRLIAGGLLWMVFAFAGALILNRSFARELINDCLDALVSSPTPGSALFSGKALSNLVLLLV